ncbi:MAG: ribosome silencing factor [Gammaproteobacteria bacterium]|nr:ribosome silencing factor [Gammaproteobacteria bacterium]
MTSDKALKLVLAEVEEIKGDNPVAVDVRKVTDMTDYMLVVGGTSTRHVKAIADRIKETAKANNLDILGYEGEDDKEWILLDLNTLVVHVMLPTAREDYQLESLWRVSPDDREEKPNDEEEEPKETESKEEEDNSIE